MSIVKELREKQARIATNARAKFDEITDSTPAERAAEIEREFDAMMAEHDAIGARADRAAKLEAAERSLDAGDGRRPKGNDGKVEGRDDGKVPEYRDAFYRMLAAGGDVSELSAQDRIVLRAGVQKDAEFRAQSTSGSAGGYTVPTTLAGFIDTAMKAWGPMYDEDLCTTITTSSGNTFEIPTVDDTASVAVAHTENTALTDDGGSDVTFGKASIGAYMFDTEFVRWSMEIDHDTVLNMEQFLGTLLGERLGRIANSKLTTGSGSSDVKGIVTASSAGKTAASATAITADEILDLIHSVDPAYRASPKARLMFNDATKAVIRKLKDGQGNFLWQMGDITKGQPDTLFGYRYSINQAMDSIAASKKVIVFGDFSKFYVRKVGSPVIGVMRERFWPDLGIAGLIRFDGEISHSGAIKHLITAAS